MKIKNIAFFGVMASILSVAGAHAATTQTIIASKNYVDGKITGINTTLGETYATKAYADTAASNAQSAAEATAAADATSKANAAQAAAISAAATDATTKANAKVSSATTISSSSTTTAPNEKAVSTALSGKASASDLTSHTGNTTVHITADERTAWNAKQNAITSTNKLPAANVSGLATVATSGKASDLNNDAGFLKAADISGKADKATNLAASGTTNKIVQYNDQGIIVAGTTAGSLATKSSVTSAEITDGTITSSDISSTAGITKAQLASAVQTSLGKADTALQSSDITGKVNVAQGSTNKNKILITDNNGDVTTAATIANTQVSGLGSLATKNAVASADITDGTITTSDISSTAGITKGQLASAVQTSLGKADTALQSSDITGKADKANITAATGNNLVSYNAQGIVTGGTAAGTLATKNAVSSTEITDGTIVNADVSTSAAIAYTKMAAPTVDINGGTSVTCSSADPCVLSYDGSAYSWTKFVY